MRRWIRTGMWRQWRKWITLGNLQASGYNWVPILRRGLGDQIRLCKVWDEIYENSWFNCRADYSRPGFCLELEKLSEGKGRAPRFLSGGEIGYLKGLVGRHGEDVEAMARDRKLNPDQRTAGELRRSIKKAGGLEAMKG
jgi:hypothetical protein